MYRRIIKRLLDILLSIIAIVVLSPVLLIIAILVRAFLGKPIIFKQIRPGLNERLFTLYKFRTMVDKYDCMGNLLPDELRMTKFGDILRNMSLDELPELFNILKGDMSIVGPRPLLVQYLPLYDEQQKRRHSVRPGLTGLAQINGRNSIKWKEKFNYDLEYVEKMSFMYDMRIVLDTIKKVIQREGINSETAATMELFTGNNEELSDQNN
jgi:undecaprenyl phosphate N,N'-diacetylbacillosamine 1-phosphate transferase